MDITGKKIVVVGAGKSGVAVARYCAEEGADVVLNDNAERSQFGEPVQALESLGVTCHFGEHSETVFADADVVILSPGVPPDLEALKVVRARNVPVIGEIELASQLTDRPLIGVTGTNGKSTTVSLIHAMLEKSGIRSGLGGNIGKPFLELVTDNNDYDVFVLEISSYQLETIVQFHSHIAILLNISADHLSRHRDLTEYAAAKGRLFTHQSPDDWVVYNEDDAEVVREAQKSDAHKIPFSIHQQVTPGLFFQDGEIIYSQNESEEIYDLTQFSLAGEHNLENLMAAIGAARLAGGDAVNIQRAIDIFTGLPHRFERLGTYQGVAFINDSKATNVGAAVRSVTGLPRGHLILLAGGQDKGSSYQPLAESLQDCQAKHVFLYGEAAEKIRTAIANTTPTSRAETLEEAFKSAVREARAGDTVLLAPACASFDQFKDFEERGKRFRQLVSELGETA